nr:formin-like protein 20 isoform X2 [Aegilops tauschii subsp. strangulata]
MAVVHNRTSPGSRRPCRLHPLPRRTPPDLHPHPPHSTGSPHAAPPPAMGAGYPPPPPPAPPDPRTTRPWRWLLPSPGIPAPPTMKGSSSSGRALQHRQPRSYSCNSTATPPSDGRPWHANMPSRRKSFPLSTSAFLVGEACHRSSFQSKSDMGRSRARARQPLSNISMLALPRNQEPHDRFPFFSSLPSVSSQDVTSRDGHGRPMPERRRPRTHRHPDPLHAISISPETCTKSHPAPSPPFAPRPVALQPERLTDLCLKQRRGAPCHEPLRRWQTSRLTPPPTFFSAATHHPFAVSYGVDADGKRRPVPGGGERGEAV